MKAKRLKPAIRKEMLNRPLQPRVVRAIQDRYRAGESVAEIATDYDLSRSCIRQLIVEVR